MISHGGPSSSFGVMSWILITSIAEGGRRSPTAVSANWS
jgi:hypothetical protein